jgi:hypothetical protein
MIGSRSVGLARLAPALNAMEAAISNASSLESAS